MKVYFHCGSCGARYVGEWNGPGVPHQEQCRVCARKPLMEPRYAGEPDRSVAPWLHGLKSRPPRLRYGPVPS